MNTIVDKSAPRGKRVFATKNYLPGELVLEEQPITVLPDAYLVAFRQKLRLEGYAAHVLANFSWFNNELSPEQQAQVLMLYGPSAHWDDTKIKLNISQEEKKLLIQYWCIMSHNSFDMGKGDWALFSQMASFSHSCGANCHYTLSANKTTMQCRANQPISAGEELTISYDQNLDLSYTHFRRQSFREGYHFTCHCPRCDAPGDDTRQFDCFDPACRGVMMVCQSLSDHDESWSQLDADFSQRHLLPCTVCHCAASAQYEQEQFQVERLFPERIRGFLYEEQCASEARNRQMYIDMVGYIDEWQFPMRHSACLPVHGLLLRLLPLTSRSLEEYRQALKHRLRVYIQACEGVMPHPSAEILSTLRELCNECVINLGEMAEHNTDLRGFTLLPVDAKMLLQKTLRMVLILHGRAVPHDCVWRAAIDMHLLKALTELPAPVCDMQVCAFCEESPLRAALTLSRCGKCKQVCYCSTACQKAHWKLHKKTCGGI